MEYDVIYSNRKTLAVSIRCGRVIVRAPKGFSRLKIRKIIKEHEKMISERLAASQKAPSFEVTKEEEKRLRRAAKLYFEKKTAEFAALMGLEYSTVKITANRRGIGSCDEKKNIRFSFRLMLYPEDVREYVVVHELAHLIEMNHSPAFWSIVARYSPDYKRIKKILVR